MSDDMDLNAPATKGDLRDLGGRLESRLDGQSGRLDGQDGNLRRLNLAFAQMSGDLAEIKRDVRELFEVKAELVSLKGMIVGLAASVEASLRKHVYQGDMLMDHEQRLKALESKPQ